MRLGAAGAVAEVAVIPTGSLALDAALGVGGIPRGRVTEIYGPEASGKTTLALHVIAEAQKLLFNSVTRAAEEFKHFLDVEPCIGDFQPGVATTAETPEIALLDTFNDQAATPRKAR